MYVFILSVVVEPKYSTVGVTSKVDLFKGKCWILLSSNNERIQVVRDLDPTTVYWIFVFEMITLALMLSLYDFDA